MVRWQSETVRWTCGRFSFLSFVLRRCPLPRRWLGSVEDRASSGFGWRSAWGRWRPSCSSFSATDEITRQITLKKSGPAKTSAARGAGSDFRFCAPSGDTALPSGVCSGVDRASRSQRPPRPSCHGMKSWPEIFQPRRPRRRSKIADTRKNLHLVNIRY